ncbi:MAG: transglutaminase domain-containing protein [Planctomycetes bacterium]|nr:transglutaminase domain-containing protein [Planctomycetota bacterium]
MLEYVNPVTYEITQRITVTNHEVSALDLLELNLPIPLDWPEQAVGRVTITGDRPFRLRDRDEDGMIVRSLYRGSAALPGPRETRSLAVTYRVTRKEIRTDAKVLASRRYEPYDEGSGLYRRYTRSEKLIETDAAEIKMLAETLKAQTEGPYHFARAAYDYVVEHTEYISPSPSHGARECLAKGRADCGSYTALFVALCRAGGVPARTVAGCWAIGQDQWHCWAEFLLPGVGWVPVDPSAGERGPQERAYYFGNLDNNRVSLAKTFNLTVETTTGSTDLGFVQVGTWWWYPAPGSTGSKMAVEHFLVGKRADN